MPCWPPPRFSSWECDENDRLILLKVPEQIQIHTFSQTPHTALTLLTLPSELHFSILHHLPPVDRVCLALTCRRLCSSVLASPRLDAESWLRFATHTDFSNRYWNPNAHYLALAPEHYQLCQRLAHGWVDKKVWRYCWSCHKILPRSEDWWWKSRDHNGEKRLQGRKNPRWAAKTGVEKADWARWSRHRKLKWIVHVWCKAGWEDSSIVGCDWCRDKLYADDAKRMEREFNDPKHTATSSYRDMDVTSFVGTRHPVECPACVERELTYSRLPSRRVVLRKTFWSIVGCLRDWCVGLCWCLGSTVIGLIMLLWSCIKWVGRAVTSKVLSCLPCNGRTRTTTILDGFH